MPNIDAHITCHSQMSLAKHRKKDYTRSCKKKNSAKLS